MDWSFYIYIHYLSDLMQRLDLNIISNIAF